MRCFWLRAQVHTESSSSQEYLSQIIYLSGNHLRIYKAANINLDTIYLNPEFQTSIHLNPNPSFSIPRGTQVCAPQFANRHLGFESPQNPKVIKFPNSHARHTTCNLENPMYTRYMRFIAIQKRDAKGVHVTSIS